MPSAYRPTILRSVAVSDAKRVEKSSSRGGDVGGKQVRLEIRSLESRTATSASISEKPVELIWAPSAFAASTAAEMGRTNRRER